MSARTSGGRRDRHGITLFAVAADAPGLDIHGYPAQDGQRVAELTLAGVEVLGSDVVGAADEGLPLLETALAQGIAALAAEAVGAMDGLHALTVDYLKTRKQFGAAIGSFQNLQHRAVDMLIALEQARSMAMLAAMMAEAPASERDKAMSAVKVQINRSARFVGQQAVQLHGGIGMTLEYKAGHYFKRLTAIESLFGDTDHHLARLSAGRFAGNFHRRALGFAPWGSLCPPGERAGRASGKAMARNGQSSDRFPGGSGRTLSGVRLRGLSRGC